MRGLHGTKVLFRIEKKSCSHPIIVRICVRWERFERSERIGLHRPFLLSNQVRNGRQCLWIFVYDSMQEFLFDSERSRICCRCCSCAGDGTWALLLREFKCWGGGNDCLRRRLNAGLRLYFSLAWIKSSLNTCEMFKFSFADTSTKPFSHFIVTNSLVLSVSTWKCTFD